MFKSLRKMMKVTRTYKSSKYCTHVLVVFFLGILIFNYKVHLCDGVGINDQNTMNDDEIEKEDVVSESKTGTVIDAAKALFSLPTGYSYQWVFKAKDLFRNYFAPPINTDFRDGDRGEEGAAEKVKEAVVRSFDESKETVEGTAKSAAKFAEEAVEKLKRTFSGKRKTDEETEL